MKRPATPSDTGTLLQESPLGLAMRRAKVGILQARRLLSWSTSQVSYRRPPIACSGDGFAHCSYRRRIAITRTDSAALPILEQGKRVNLAIAAPHFDGLLLEPGQPLSFWRTLGRVRAARGFRHGIEVRGGCIVPTLGGGLCLLSNALFRMACELGWQIVERHGHTVEAVPSQDPIWGLDATVFWPHVDLRVAPRTGPARLTVRVTDDALSLAVHTRAPNRLQVQLRSVGDVEYQRDGHRMRGNRIVRTISDQTTGTSRVRDVVADNRRRLLHRAEMRRNCLTCDERGCHARPGDLPTLALGGR